MNGIMGLWDHGIIHDQNAENLLSGTGKITHCNMYIHTYIHCTNLHSAVATVKILILNKNYMYMINITLIMCIKFSTYILFFFNY